MENQIKKIGLAVLIAFLVAFPNFAMSASSTEGFRFLFPPSDKFMFVEKKLSDDYYIVNVGEDQEGGARNICDRDGQLVSDVNFENISMTLEDNLYVNLRGNHTAIINLKARTAKEFDFSI
jgi:hypothetical protein